MQLKGASWCVASAVLRPSLKKFDRSRSQKELRHSAVGELKKVFQEVEPVVKEGYRKAAEILRKYDASAANLLIDAEPEALAY